MTVDFKLKDKNQIKPGQTIKQIQTPYGVHNSVAKVVKCLKWNPKKHLGTFKIKFKNEGEI